MSVAADELLSQAGKLGMAGKDSNTVWIMPDSVAANKPSHDPDFDPAVLHGLLTLFPRIPPSAHYRAWRERFIHQPHTGPLVAQEWGKSHASTTDDCIDDDATVLAAGSGMDCAAATAAMGCSFSTAAFGVPGTLADICAASCGCGVGNNGTTTPCDPSTDDDHSQPYSLYSGDPLAKGPSGDDGDPTTIPRCTGYRYDTFSSRTSDGNSINLYAAFAYDSAFVVANALHEMLTTSNEPEILLEQMAGRSALDPGRVAFGNRLYDTMVNISFTGVTGEVNFHPGQDIFSTDASVTAATTASDSSNGQAQQELGGAPNAAVGALPVSETSEVVEQLRYRGDRFGGIGYTLLGWNDATNEYSDVGSWSSTGSAAHQQGTLLAHVNFSTVDGGPPPAKLCPSTSEFL